MEVRAKTYGPFGRLIGRRRNSWQPKDDPRCKGADKAVFHLFSQLLGDEPVATLIEALQCKQPKKLDISRVQCPRLAVAGYR